MQFHRTHQKGFTLVEMIVAMAIFTIALLIIVGALVSLTNESRKARAVRVVMDNLGASVESMSRTMRMGSDFRCLNSGQCGTNGISSVSYDCEMDIKQNGVEGGQACIQFMDQYGTYTRYLVQNNHVEVWNYEYDPITQPGQPWTPYQMTASELTINKLQFFLDGADKTQHTQPVITFIIVGTAGTRAKELTSFNLQTTVSPRTPNLP